MVGREFLQEGLIKLPFFLSKVDDASAVFYNPAGFGGSELGTEAMFSYMSYIADIGFSFAAVGVNLGDLGAIAFNIFALSTTETFPFSFGFNDFG